MRHSSLVLLLALSTACSSIASEFGGASVSQRAGILYVDDVPLDHQREVVLSGSLGLERALRIASATGSVELSGRPGDAFALTVVLYSELEGDGEVFLDDEGHLRSRSDKGGRTLIESVQGTIPMDASLRLATGTGRIAITGLMGDALLDVDTGTGSMDVKHCDLADLAIDTGTGTLTFEGCQIGTVRIDSGAGDVVASESHFGSFTSSSGTGDIRLRSSIVDSLALTSGAGDLLLVDTTVGSSELSLGTGTVVTKDAEAEELDLP